MGVFANYLLENTTLPNINLFSGRDDSYNTIEGLEHRGIAHKIRQDMTEFGSGWDPLKALFKKDFSRVLSSHSFQQALESGTVLKKLGAGSFGEANLMQATIKTNRGGFLGGAVQKLFGQKSTTFQYVRKTFTPVTKMSDVMHEVAGFNKLSDLNAPSIYGVSSNRKVYMEYIKGTNISEVYQNGGIPKSAIRDFRNFIQESHKRGIAHMDLGQDASVYFRDTGHAVGHVGEMVPRNMMLTPEGRIGVLDYGLWQDAGKAAESPLANPLFKDVTIGRYTEALTGKSGGAKALDMSVVESLERHQKLSEKSRRIFTPTLDEEKFDIINRKKPVDPLGVTSKIFSDVPTQVEKRVRKLSQASAQKSTILQMFQDGISGGRRSKRQYTSSIPTVK